MWDILAQVANTGMNMWLKNEQSDASKLEYLRQMQQTKHMAAEQLALTYNSIAQKSLEIATQFRREEFNLRSEQRGAEGQVAAQAAQIGATGNRATLAQKQSTVIPAERKMAALSADSKREQDALIRAADVEERAMVNRLMNAQPDVPDNMNYDMVPDMITGFANIGTSLIEYSRSEKAKEAEKAVAIRSGSSTGAQIQL